MVQRGKQQRVQQISLVKRAFLGIAIARGNGMVTRCACDVFLSSDILFTGEVAWATPFLPKHYMTGLKTEYCWQPASEERRIPSCVVCNSSLCVLIFHSKAPSPYTIPDALPSEAAAGVGVMVFPMRTAKIDFCNSM